MHRYFIVYKPVNMVSQFVSPHRKRLLGDLDFDFPEGTNAVGRLDDQSEGLLILTTDKTLTKRLLHPTHKHVRRYVVQVEKIVSEETLHKLRTGVEILIPEKGAITTQACEVNIIDKPHDLPPHENERSEEFPHTWLEFILTEGKNRQIRKMCRTVKHRCQRLVRTSIENIDIKGMQPGEVKEIEGTVLFELLKLNPDAPSRPDNNRDRSK